MFARKVGEQGCYFYSTDDGDFVDHNNTIWEASASVRIHLSGIDFERWFRFRLVNGKTFALVPQ